MPPKLDPPLPLRSAGPVDADRVLVQRARLDGTPDARRAAVEALIPLAYSLARRYARGDEPLEDLQQVAMLGLLKAIDGFDLERGSSFGAYAVPTIVGELRRHFRDKGWTVRVPRDLQELSLRMGRIQEDVSASIGRAPTPSELAQRLDVPVERVLEARELDTAMRPVSLDRPAIPEPGEEGAALVEQIGSDDAAYDHTDHSLAVHDYLQRLPERERQIVELRFHEELTQTQIAERLGISQMHVSRLLRRTLADLTAMAEEEAA